MLNIILDIISRGFLFFALHIGNGNSFPPALSSKDEKMYFEKFKQGDIDAKNILIEHNLRLVAHIIKKYYSSSDEQDDLISIGTIGLIKAVNSFDNTKGIKFATYASKCIENAILTLMGQFLDMKTSNSRKLTIYTHSIILISPHRLSVTTYFNQQYRKNEAY